MERRSEIRLEMTVNAEAKVVALLKAELGFVEKGGYTRPARISWRAPSIFLDSPICLNFGKCRRTEPCEACPLMPFVPQEHRKKPIPCHHIPLTPMGDTVNSMEGWADQQDIEEKVKQWLRETLRRLEVAEGSPAEEQ
jgi:hypothetical protein